jgi:hypothetical protein
MNRLGKLATFVWEFVVGDDWTIALGVVGALGITAAVAELDSAWFVMPLAVVGLLTFSVWRATQSTARSGDDQRDPYEPHREAA